MSPDLIGLLLLSLVLLTSGGDAERVEVLSAGTQEVAAAGAVVVAGADVVVPAGEAVAGPVHVLDGSLVLDGAVEGDVLVLGGTLELTDDARVAGVVRHYGGEVLAAPQAAVRVEGLDVVAERGGPVQDLASTVVGAVLLGALGAIWARRRPGGVAVVGDALSHHPVVVLTVGALVAVTGISVLVFMAFTLVLLPVTVLGLLAGAVLVGLGAVGLGGLVGRRLPVGGPAATALGTVLVVVGLRLLGLVPVVGDLVALALLLAGLGAVLVTYLGLRSFSPVALPA
ncbi:MAG: hypothetical protein H5T83_04845 [Actinotalea sp.]|nr:hypothetical protein [Actinotalea sp.]